MFASIAVNWFENACSNVTETAAFVPSYSVADAD
jgi:hypothetical protein